MMRAHNDDTQRMSNLHLKAMNEETEQGKHTQRHMARNTNHVINHGLSMREAGLRVQQNLQCSTVASIVRVLWQTNK